MAEDWLLRLLTAFPPLCPLRAAQARTAGGTLVFLVFLALTLRDSFFIKVLARIRGLVLAVNRALPARS